MVLHILQERKYIYNYTITIAGIKSIIINGTANNGSGNVGRAWNMVYIDKKWYHVDCTWDE